MFCNLQCASSKVCACKLFRMYTASTTFTALCDVCTFDVEFSHHDWCFVHWAGQFCGKEDKEKFEIDLKGSGSGTESNFGNSMDPGDNLISQ